MATTLQLPAATVEYLRLPVTASSSTGAVNPTSLPFKWQLVEGSGEPAADAWTDGDWETINGIHYGRILVQDLVKGHRYRVFTQILDNPEHPVHLAGVIEAI